MTLIPDEISTIVFNNGTWKGLKTLIPKGGHTAPTSILGDKLLWKNAQKNLTKIYNIIAENNRINKGQTCLIRINNSRKEKFDILKIKLLFIPCCKLEYRIIL